MTTEESKHSEINPEDEDINLFRGGAPLVAGLITGCVTVWLFGRITGMFVGLTTMAVVRKLVLRRKYY